MRSQAAPPSAHPDQEDPGPGRGAELQRPEGLPDQGRHRRRGTVGGSGAKDRRETARDFFPDTNPGSSEQEPEAVPVRAGIPQGQQLQPGGVWAGASGHECE